MCRPVFAVVALYLLALFLVAGCATKIEKPPVLVPEVVVETVQVRDVQPYIEALGHTEAYEFVQIPARVSGFLREIRYTPGEIVTAGAPLFLIEPDQYEAEVKAAEASLASAKAQLKLSEANFARTKDLVAQGAQTKQDLDTDEARRDEAQAGVLRAEAQLATAKLNLSYTDVRSPITGKVDRSLVDVGNIVAPLGQHATLTTVAGMDPIYVYFDISDHQFNRMRQYVKEIDAPGAKYLTEQLQKAKAARQADSDAYRTSIGLAPTEPGEPKKPTVPAADPKPENPEDPDIEFEVAVIKGAEAAPGEYPFKGLLDMTGNVIDKSTGTITIRGAIPNAEYAIFPGQICRVRIPTWLVKDAVLVKTEGIGTDLNQNFVYVVDEKNVARRRVVELGAPQPDGTRVVLKGLEKGERYVAGGIQKTRDGSEVKPVEAETTPKEKTAPTE